MRNVDALMTAKARMRNSAGGTSGSRRRTMRIGNAMAAASPMPSAMNAVGSDHRCSWPRMSPKVMPPTAMAMTIEPSQSSRRGASSLRDSGTYRMAAYRASSTSGTLTRNAIRHENESTMMPPTRGP